MICVVAQNKLQVLLGSSDQITLFHQITALPRLRFRVPSVGYAEQDYQLIFFSARGVAYGGIIAI